MTGTTDIILKKNLSQKTDRLVAIGYSKYIYVVHGPNSVSANRSRLITAVHSVVSLIEIPINCYQQQTLFKMFALNCYQTL